MYGQMGIQLSDLVENIVGKGEIGRYEMIEMVIDSFGKGIQLRAIPPFHHNVFKSCLLLMRQNEYLCSKGLSEMKRKSPLNSKNTKINIVKFQS